MSIIYLRPIRFFLILNHVRALYLGILYGRGLPIVRELQPKIYMKQIMYKLI